METFRFLSFQVYRDSKKFYLASIRASRSFPHLYINLADQLRRAALSVCLNIAEGSAKYSDKEFHRYLEISIGSIHESLACCDIARDNKLMNETEYTLFHDQAKSISKQLGGLAKKVRG